MGLLNRHDALDTDWRQKTVAAANVKKRVELIVAELYTALDQMESEMGDEHD